MLEGGLHSNLTVRMQGLCQTPYEKIPAQPIEKWPPSDKLVTRNVGNCQVTFGGFCAWVVVFNHRFSYRCLTAATHACQKNRSRRVQFGQITSGTHIKVFTVPQPQAVPGTKRFFH